MTNILMIFITMVSLTWADGEFVKHESNLLQIAGQISNGEKNIRLAIDEKNKTKDKAKYHELIAEIREALKKRKEDIVHYNKEYHHIKYEHPEKAGTFETKYKRFDEKTIKEFEDEINKLLSTVQQNVKKKYNP